MHRERASHSVSERLHRGECEFPLHCTNFNCEGLYKMTSASLNMAVSGIRDFKDGE
jgi:hypothetical protein